MTNILEKLTVFKTAEEYDNYFRKINSLQTFSKVSCL